jgi:hypothetical protein
MYKVITTGTVRPPRGRTGHHQYLPGRVDILIDSNFPMIAILLGDLSNPPPFPLSQDTDFGNQDVRRGQQINNSSGRRTAY